MLQLVQYLSESGPFEYHLLCLVFLDLVLPHLAFLHLIFLHLVLLHLFLQSLVLFYFILLNLVLLYSILRYGMNSVTVILINYELQTFFTITFTLNLFIFSRTQLLFLQVFCIKTCIFYSSLQNTLICLQHFYKTE